MTKKNSTLIILIFIYLIFSIISIYSHGVNCDFITNGIGIKMHYDGGAPFSYAEVTLYSPDDYKNPYLKSQTDKQGLYFFKPNKPGEWIILIRDKKGHGIRKNIKVGPDGLLVQLNKTSTRINLAQKIILAICVIWGMIGTALFFIRRK
ncbi:MAG: hypothetical protein KAT05_14880 [Spirochaetes bacterium]|nr:hypothetical protein [Spirochaetota bacterium]